MIEDHYIVYYMMYRNKSYVYNDSRTVVGVHNNAVIVEDRITDHIYVIYFENQQKALQTAELIATLIQLDIPVDKAINKIAEIEKMIIEEIERTFLIFKEKPP
ncbi:MAG: hypothetical protein QXK07_05930 [Desulfurococcaceae archaeon]